MFRVILADPPWSYNNRRETRKDNPTKATKFGIGVSAGKYSIGTMKLSDMISLKKYIDPVITSDALCFMWVVCPQIKEGIQLLEGWGFKYATVAFQWTKLYPKAMTPFYGPGRYTPSNMEMVLVGARGRLWHPNTGSKPGQEVRVPHPRDAHGKIIHSRKPSQVASKLLEWLGPHVGEENGFLELFATQETPGWTCMGYDVTGNYLHTDLDNYYKENILQDGNTKEEAPNN